MKIKLIFDVSQYMLYVPDGYVTSVKSLQVNFLDWCETQRDALGNAPGNKLGYVYSKELFLRYVNEVLLENSTEIAYFINHESNRNEKTPVIVF